MADTWETLQSECLHCHDCALAETRTHVVFGDGSRQAKILLIGEGPGQHEDEQGIPFVGKAGMLLDDMLEQLGAYASAQDDPDNSGFVLVRARIGINDSFHRWVMKYGGNVEILRPENLRREFAEKVAELYRQYWD